MNFLMIWTKINQLSLFLPKNINTIWNKIKKLLNNEEIMIKFIEII